MNVGIAIKLISWHRDRKLCINELIMSARHCSINMLWVSICGWSLMEKNMNGRIMTEQRSLSKVAALRIESSWKRSNSVIVQYVSNNMTNTNFYRNHYIDRHPLTRWPTECYLTQNANLERQTDTDKRWTHSTYHFIRWRNSTQNWHVYAHTLAKTLSDIYALYMSKCICSYVYTFQLKTT